MADEHTPQTPAPGRLTGIVPTVVEGLKEVYGETTHLNHPWVKYDWKLVFTTCGMDHARVNVTILSRMGGRAMDKVTARSDTTREWVYSCPDITASGSEMYKKRAIAMEILLDITRELDALIWRTSAMPTRGK